MVSAEKMQKDLMMPLPWPPARRSNDKLVPVLKGSERRLTCVYLVSPRPDYAACQIGIGHPHLGRLAGLATMQGRGYAVDLFGTLWFQYAQDAQAVVKSVIGRLRGGEGAWFAVPVSEAYGAMVAAARDVGASCLDYEGYCAACQWRSELPLDRRLAVTRREVRAVGQRMVDAAELAAAAHGIYFSPKKK